MVFSSAVFLIGFLPLFLLIYWAADKKYKNVVILISSILFYSWGAPKFIFVILGTTFIDYHLVKWMWNTNTPLKRRLMLTLSVSVNLGLLVYFKYSNFFVENTNEMLAAIGIEGFKWTKLILPIGISFYTFETITYVVDVYRRVHKPLDNFWDYQVYIIFFPKLIAGPIIRYHELADQITDRSANETLDNRLTGFYRFVIGLAKKVLIANVMGAEADRIMSLDYASLDATTAWIGILAYTFQIYFDFSGYSDMAIGIGKMTGFKFPENFSNPYISQSISEFWRRWHMTLGAWMRNYLYIPLGGNKVDTKARLFFNLWIVFIFSGFWHGASWSFIIWGAYHGLFLILDRLFLLKFLQKIGKFTATLFTFFVAVIGWVIFRIEDFSQALLYYKSMFSFNFKSFSIAQNPEFTTFLLVAIIFSFFAAFKKGQKIQDMVYFDVYPLKRHLAISALVVILFLVSLASITSSGFNPFIYYRF
jgi:alginate O-acetyltransferase complex protein AlgI